MSFLLTDATTSHGPRDRAECLVYACLPIVYHACLPGQAVPQTLFEWAKSKEEHLRDKAELELVTGAAKLVAQLPSQLDSEEAQRDAARRKREEKERKAKAFLQHAEALAASCDHIPAATSE
jgi:hypothetical protein